MPKPRFSDVFDRLAEQVAADIEARATDDAVEAAPEDADNAEAAPEDAPPAAEDAPDDGAAGAAPGEAGPALAGRWRRRAVPALIAAIVVASLGFSGFLGWRLYEVHATAAAGEAALAAAKSYALVLTTLDSKSIDDNYTQAIDGATGEFKEAYSLGSAQLRQTLIDNNAAGKGVVVDAAVKSATKAKVEVLLFVDQSITNSVRSEPRIDRNRIQMTMELVDGRWLASQVELV
ncbi:Mce protein [Mycobacterium talmoniae]|uniref:Mce protein n=1 Tax=Mycobacterium talmoniae TaxID=1858794 RepID=A0A1S1NGZ0_9MYCO|nr:Mce protein [Mycobacterium talmoniae]OHV03682.1 Mce protein [Mycobacterium talmoniae]